MMWAAAVILEYSFSPALADIASASSENARAASWLPCRWWVRLSRPRQAINAGRKLAARQRSTASRSAAWPSFSWPSQNREAPSQV